MVKDDTFVILTMKRNLKNDKKPLVLYLYKWCYPQQYHEPKSYKRTTFLFIALLWITETETKTVILKIFIFSIMHRSEYLFL